MFRISPSKSTFPSVNLIHYQEAVITQLYRSCSVWERCEQKSTHCSARVMTDFVHKWWEIHFSLLWSTSNTLNKDILNSNNVFGNWDSLGQRRSRPPVCGPTTLWVAWPKQPGAFTVLAQGRLLMSAPGCLPARSFATSLCEMSPDPPSSQTNQEADIFKPDASQRSLSD